MIIRKHEGIQFEGYVFILMEQLIHLSNEWPPTNHQLSSQSSVDWETTTLNRVFDLNRLDVNPCFNPKLQGFWGFSTFSRVLKYSICIVFFVLERIFLKYVYGWGIGNRNCFHSNVFTKCFISLILFQGGLSIIYLYLDNSQSLVFWSEIV